MPTYRVDLKADGWIDVEAQSEEDAETTVRKMGAARLSLELGFPRITAIAEVNNAA